MFYDWINIVINLSWIKKRVRDKVLLLLPTDSNKVLLQRKGPFEVVEVLNRMDYRFDVIGIIGTYHDNMLKQYVERQSMTSHRLTSIKTAAVVDEADETGEYSLGDSIVSLTKRTKSYKDVSISNQIQSEQICEAVSLIEQ